MKAARAAYIGGFSDPNVAAGEAFGIPVSGTMAHSWVQSFDRERDAFEAFVGEYGDDSVLPDRHLRHRPRCGNREGGR